jgi:parallel beta-helix repeat protein
MPRGEKGHSRSARGRRLQGRWASRLHLEALESRVLLTGANEQALLNAIQSALQPNSSGGLAAFNTLLQGSTALGSTLPVVGTGMSAYNPGAAISGLLSRLGSSPNIYTSVSGLVSALQNGAGISVTSSSDLLNNIELAVDFSVTSVVSVPLSPNYGITFVDPGSLSMSTTLSENLTLGAYWDANTSSAVFYVNATNDSIQVSSSVSGFTFSAAPTVGQLGFLEFDTPTTASASKNLSGNKLLSTTVSFSPTFTFSLNEQPPVDSAEPAGRLTLSQLTTVPLATLETTQLAQSAPATVTAAISTPLAGSAQKIVFTWADVNAPANVTSTLTTDPTLSALNQLQTIGPGEISAGLDEVTGDLTAAAADGTGGSTAFSTDLPLINESVDGLVNFVGSSSNGSFYDSYLTNFTDPMTNGAGSSSEPFQTDSQLLTILTNLSSTTVPENITIQKTASSLTETASGSELIFTLDLDVLIDSTTSISLNVQPQLNFNSVAGQYVGLPQIYVQTAVNTQLTFGVNGANNQFFVEPGSSPALQANVTASLAPPGNPSATSYTGQTALGYLGVQLTGASFNLSGDASVTLVDPMTDNPPTPGIISAHELESGLQPSGTVLPIPATDALTGAASATIPMSVANLANSGIAPATINISWANVATPSTYTFNTAALTPYLGFSNLTASTVYNALSELPGVLSAASDSSQFGRDLSFFGSGLGSTVTLGNVFDTETIFNGADGANAPATYQSLVTLLDSELGAPDVVLSSTSDGIEIGLTLSQQYSGNVNWSLSHPLMSTFIDASGSVPASATYNATLDLGLVLTPTATPANQFYLLGGTGGSSISGSVLVSTGLSGPATVGNLSVTISGGTAAVEATGSGGALEPGVRATIALPLGSGAAGQRLALPQSLGKVDSYYGPMTVNGSVNLVLPLTGLPKPGTSPQVQIAWPQLGTPSSITVTPTNLGDLSTANSFAVAPITAGLQALNSLVGLLPNSPTLQTNLFLLNTPASGIINYAGDFQTALQKLESAISSASSASALNSDIEGVSLASGVTITPTSNDNFSGNDFEYNLAFNINQPINATLPFSFGSGVDSTGSALNISLQTNLPITASFTGGVTFGFDPQDGFYIDGGTGTGGLSVNVQVSTSATFPNQTIGMFGSLPFGVSGATASMMANVGLSLNPTGDNGQKISTMDLTQSAPALLQLTITGSGSVDLPFGLHLGSDGPGVISSFTANWDPTRSQPVEYGANDATTLSGGFGDVYFDYTEFVTDMLKPVLQQIENYDPIPPELINALNYQIPIIDQTPAQILQAYGDYSGNDDLSTILQIVSILGSAPSGGNELDLSAYLPGAPATGDMGAVNGDAGSDFSEFQSFVQGLESSTNGVVTMPVFDNTQQAIVSTLLGQDVTLIQVNTGPFNLTASTDAITFLPSTPVFDIGIASVNLSITGAASISLMGDIDIGLSTRGLLGDGLINSNGSPQTGPDLLDGFFVNDGVGVTIPDTSGMQQIALEVEAHVTITGSLDLGGFLSIASINGSLGPYGEVGVRVNSLVPNATNTGFLTNPNAPSFFEIAGYQGAPAGNGMAYLDEISYIANAYSPLCAVMPDAQIGLQLTISATVGYPPLGFSFTILSQQFPIANFDYPCDPVQKVLAQVQGNELVMIPNSIDTNDGANTISAAVYYNPNQQNQPIGIAITESNKSEIYYQDFTYAQLAGVNTLIMNGTEGSDTFNFDPNLTLSNIGASYYTSSATQTNNPDPIRFLQINTEDGNDSVKLTNNTPQNSTLQGVTINGGTGTDFFQGTYCPDMITLGNGANTAIIGTGNGEVLETGGTDSISGGNGNDTVLGGSGSANIDLGDGNNFIQQGPGAESIILGNGKNLVTASSLSFNSGVASNGSTVTSGVAPAPQGTQVAFVQGNSDISQLITQNWSPSDTYSLSFEAAASPGDATPNAEQIQVLVDGNVVDTVDPTSTTYQTFTTPAFSVSTVGSGGLDEHVISFRGLDPTEGNNIAFIDNVALLGVSGTVAPIPAIADGDFAAHFLTAGSIFETDITPNPEDTNPAIAAFDPTFGPGWVFVEGIGTDSVVAGNGANTIHGSIGGSTIYVGDGQNIILQSGTGIDFINSGSFAGSDSTKAGGGNDFISLTPASGGQFTVNGGGGGKTLLSVQADANMALNDQSVTISGLGFANAASVQFTNITSVSLSGEAGNESFDVSNWTGSPVQINGGGGNDSIVSTDDTNFTLTDGSLSRSDGTTFALNGIGAADLTGGASDNSFDITGWHGNAVLTGSGGNDSIVANGVTNATLTNTLLQRSGAANITLNAIGQAIITTNPAGGASVNASAFTGNVALLGEGNNNTLEGGAGSNYLVGGSGADNLLTANGATDNEIIGGAGSGDTINGGGGQNLLVSSNGGSDSITTAAGPSHVYTPGNNNAINAQGGNAIVYVASTGDVVNTGASTTDQVIHPGDPGTVPSDFTAPSTSDLWEFPALPVAATATLPSSTASQGQWAQIGASASGGGLSSSIASAVDPSIVATGSGSSAVQYVAWADDRGGTYEIFVAEDTSGGWKELAGSAHGGGVSSSAVNSTQPSIILDSSGNPIVAWTESNNIYVADYSPSANSGAGGWVALGTSLSAGGISNTNHAASASIVETPSGPVVAWLDSSAGAANIYVKTFNGTTWVALAGGAASGAGVSASSSSVSGLSLAASGATVAVAWDQPGTSAGSSIYLLQYSGSGFSPLAGSASGTGISGAFASQMPSIAYAGGLIYTAWAANTDGTTNIVAASGNGGSWTPVSVATPSSAGANQVSRGAASDPVLSSNGTALDLVWIEDRLPATPDQAVAIYANRLSGAAFVDQLRGDSSFDGILGRPTSLSQPATLAISVDSAGHPFVSWGDTSSGSSQIYMLGDTLNVTQVYYVNDAFTAEDSYTTAAGSSANDGLTPATPLDSVADVLGKYTLATGAVILVDSGTYAGFTLGSSQNGVIIIGSPDGTTDITGAVAINGATNITLSSMDLAGGLSISGASNIEIHNDIGGPENKLAKNEGGAASISGSSAITLDSDAFTGVSLSGAASSGVTIINDLLPASGIAISGPVSGLVATNDLLSSVNLTAAAQGLIENDNVSGGGLTINAGFTGAISANFIHGAKVGVNYLTGAPLNDNQIFDNQTGVIVAASSGGLGYFAGATPNFIVNNGTGVSLGSTLQGQYISHNDTGVIGSGVLGGSTLVTANQIEDNTTGINFNGTVQYNRIDYNEDSMVVQNGQLIAHNLFYNNSGQNLQTLGASNVEIFNNSFYSTNQTNIFVNGGSTDVEIINNILWTGGGYDLDIDNASRTGYFSDYNDLYTTGAGQIVHYLVDFDDILDWQDDVALYDLHSIGATVVNPTAAQPQFANLGFADFNVFPAAAGLRKTSPTIATGDPETDLALPPAEYTNELANPSFENGTTGWTVNPGGTTQSGSPAAFDGNSYFYSGAVASGFAQQTLSLVSEGYTTAAIDAGTLDISFGGRIQSAPKSPADQGQIVITFLDGSGNIIGTPVTVSASNVTNRWELVGGRVHIPVGARNVIYRFQSLRESGSTDQSYLDAAFLYVVANTIATDIGAYGASNDSVEEPVDEKIQLETPDLYVNWTLTQSHQILWSTFDNTGDDPVEINLYQQTSNGLTFVTTIASSTPDTGSYAWIPQESGLTYGTYGLKIEVSLVGQPAISDMSTETFTIPPNGTTFYVNDGSTTGDQYTTAAGNNRASGLLPSAPLPLLTTLLREYSLGAQDTVYVDNGNYFDFAAVELSGNPAIGSGQGVTIIGPTNSGDSATLNALGFTSPAVIDVNDASFVSISNIGVAGGNYGVWLHNGSSNFTGLDITATMNLLGGVRVESDSSANTSLSGIVADNNTGDGIFAGGPIVSITNSSSFNNTGDGFDLADSGAALLTDDTAYGDVVGLNVTNSTSGTTTTVGNSNLALGLGNKFYNNTTDGINASSGSILLAGNTVYGQTAKNDAGINIAGGETATENVVYDNYNGINSLASILTYNNVYSNSNVGIESDGGGTLTGNVVDQNGIGVQSFSAPNSSQGPYLTNNLLYNSSTAGIALYGGNNSTFYNNTVYQLSGNAISVAPDGSLISANVQIENNILWSQDGYDLAINPASENGFVSDYNDLYVTAAGQVGQWQNFAQANLQAWINASNNDADSISVDPLFVNVAAGDFHVQSTTGSYHGGSLAPVVGSSGLPVFPTATLTADANESPTIDRGNSTFSFASEPSPNGGFINLGSTGNTAQASLSPTSYVLVLKPIAGATLIEGQNFTISWRSQDMSGTANIELLQGSTPVLSIASGVSNNGSYVWAIPTSLTAQGGYTISVTRNASPTATGVSGAFTISAPIHNYYVNEASTGGIFTTAGGSDSNSGLDPADPKATIQALLSAYTIGANSIVYVDEGMYNLTGNIVLTAANSGITIEGVPGGATLLNRGNVNTGSYDFDLQNVAGATIESLTITGAYYGINASYNNGSSTNVTVTNCTFFGDAAAGINLANNFTTTYVTTGDVINSNVFYPSAPAPTLPQGSFTTTPNLPDKSFSTSPTGSDWTFTGGSGIATYDDSLVSSNSGNGAQLAVLPDAGSFSQVISGFGAGSYALNISAAQDAKGNNGGQNFEVLVDGVVIATITPSSTSYANYTTSQFTVLPGAHVISFLGLNTAGGSNTALINSVSFATPQGNPSGVVTEGDQFTLSNNTAYNLNYGFYIQSGDGSTITGNTAYNDNVGLSVTNGVVTGNIAHNNNTGIAFSGTTLSGNTTYNNTSVGINLASGTASGNISYGNPYGIEVSGAGTISDNLIYNNTTAGITVTNGSIVNGNVIYGNAIGISASIYPPGAVGGPTIDNNLLYNNTTGMNFSGGDVTPVLNNTVYQTGGVAVLIQSAQTNQLMFRDNIIWDIGGTDISVGAQAETNVTFDYNDLYTTGGGQIGLFGTTPAATLAAWQSVTGMDLDSISADPLFVNAAAGDFHVQSTTGSFHGGSLAPTLNTVTNLPIPASPGTLTADANESPTIDRGSPTDPYAAEPPTNGGYLNLGSYGDTSQASLSPAHYLFVINPSGSQTIATGQPVQITWRDEVSNTSVGTTDTVHIDILLQGNSTPVLSYTGPDIGSYNWMVPTSLAAGTYQVRITRTDSTGLVALSNPFPVAADTGIYYVNGASTGGAFTTAGGNDANSGLDPAHPKATISAILADYALTPGSVIMVDEATYNLSTNITLTAAQSGITIEGVTGKTILNRGNLNAGDYDIDLQGALNVTLENLSITGAEYGVNANYGQIVNGLTVTGSSFYADENIGIDLEGNNGSATITNNTFDDMLGANGIYGFECYTNTSAITVTGNTAFGLGYGISVTTNNTIAANTTISNNIVYDNSVGIYASEGGTGLMLVNNNTAYDNYTYNMQLGGAGLTASGNTLSQDGGAGKNESTSEIGAVVGGGIVFSGNNVFGNVIGVNLASNSVVSGNNVHNNSSYGVEGTAGTGTISGNTIDNNGGWGIIGNPIYVLSNLLYANTSGGIYLSNDYDASVIGNTVYQTTGNAFRLDGLIQNGGSAPSVILQNNIFWTTSAPALLVNDAGEYSFSTPTSDYNDLYATGAGEIAEFGGQNFTTLSSFSTELGLDTDSISADPQFVNAAAGNFHVQSTSPIIDAGNPSSEFVEEPLPNGGRVNLGYDGNTPQAATSSAATTVQVTEPTSLDRLQAGTPYTIQWISTGLLAQQTLTEVATGESVAVGEYHPNEFEVGTGSAENTDGEAVNTTGVANPAPEAVYQTGVAAATGVGNELSYLIPVPNGAYTIRLDFAESGVSSVTGREFDVLLQGQVVQSAFSVYGAAGDADLKAVGLTFTVTASGGNGISLQLKNDTTNPAFLNGFELSAANPAGTASPTADVQVSTNNGASWTTIAANVSMDAEGRGSAIWTPTTQTSAATALVRVIANNAVLTTGTSQPFFIANSGNAYYVNDSSTTGDVYTTAVGNNANSGKSPSAPMASIEAVINTYHPGAGDTIYVDNGTYNLFHDINIPVIDSGLTIQGPTAAGTAAVLNRGNTNDNVFYLVPQVTNITLSYLSITGAEFGINSPSIENPPAATSGIKVENDQIYSNADAGILSGETYNWMITGNVIHDNDITDGSYQAGIYLSSCTATILDNTVYNEPTGIAFSLPTYSPLSPAIVSYNTVYADGTGLSISGAVTVSDNIAHDNTLVGINAASGATVTGNTVYRQTATNAIGIEIAGGYVTDNQVYGNYIGIVSAGASTINANHVYSNANYGIVLESENGASFANGPGYVAIASNNLVYANATGGISVTGATYDLSLINNTVYQLIGDDINVSSSTSSTYPLNIENNILWVEAGYDLDIATAAQPGLSSNYNILYHIGASARVGLWNGTAQATLAAWQSASSQDSHSSEANPMFVNPAGADAVLGYNPTANNGNGYNGGPDDDFYLAEGSPAIDDGASWVGFSTDIDGVLRYDDPNTPNTGTTDYLPAVQSSSLFSATGGTAENWRVATPTAFGLALSFSFPFYGVNYTTIYVSSTGVIGLGSLAPTAAASSANSDAALLANTLIAPLWANLETDQTGDNIFVNTSVANQVTIRWAATNVANGAPVNFDVVLFSSGQIRFDYGSGNTGLAPTIGISQGNSQRENLTTYDGQSTLTNANSVLYAFAPGFTDLGAYEFHGTGAETTPPSITSANAAAFTYGQPNLFTVTTAPGFPSNTALSETGALPPGVTFTDNGNGTATIIGAPFTPGTQGAYPLTLTASVGTVMVTQTFTLTVGQAPMFTSAAATTLAAGQSGSFTVTTTPGFPTNTTLTETGSLPTGVTFIDNGNGTATLSGAPASSAAGTYSITLTATDGTGLAALSSTELFVLTITAAPVLTGNVEYIRLDPDGIHTDIWNNATAAGSPAQSILLSAISSLTYAGPSGGDELIVDFSAGNPLPASGLSFTGGAGVNTLEIIGTTGNDAATVNGSTVTLSTPYGGATITYSGANTIIFDGDNSGADTLTQTAQPGGGANLVFSRPTALDALNVNGGTFTIPANAPGKGTLSYTLGTIAIAAGAKLALAPSDVQADQTVLTANTFTIATGGYFDISDNSLIVNYGLGGTDPAATIRGYLTTGYNGDTWTGAGISSSFAATNPGLYAVGYADGSVDAGTPAQPGQILVKLTLAGDANLDGVVNFADLLAVSQNFNHTVDTHGNPMDWADGDFNYDGKVNFADLLLVSQNFSKTLANAESVQPVNLTGAVEYIRLDPDGIHTDIWTNATAAGTPAQSILRADISAVTYAGPAGGDLLIVDYSNGNPLPASGLTFTGGAGANTLEVIGTTGNDAATVNATTLSVTSSFGTSSIAYTVAAKIVFDGDASGADTLTQTAQPGGGATLVFSRPTAQDTLNVSGGTFTVPASAPGGGANNYPLGSVSIAAGAKLALAASDVPADQTVLAVNNLTAAGTLDLTDNVVEVNYTPGSDPVATIRGYLQSGYNSDTWTGTGIVSSNAAANPGLYAVGYADGNIDAGTPAGANQIFIKNTLAGDANLDGVVNFSDLLSVSQNFNHTLDTHGNPMDWADGDFNYDGKVNFADLLLISQNFNKHLAAGQADQTPQSFQDTELLATAADSTSPAPTTIPATAPVATAPAETAAITTVTAPSPLAESMPEASVSTELPSASAPTPRLVFKARWPESSHPSADVYVAAVLNNGQIAPLKPARIHEANAKARPFVAAPASPQAEGITDDALTGVWNAVSSGNNLLFSDAPAAELID